MAHMGLAGDAGRSEADDWGEDNEEEGEDNEEEGEDAADEMMAQDKGSGQEHKEEDEVRVKRTNKGLLKRRNPPKKGNFPCGYCPRLFQHKQSLTRHVATHVAPNGNHDCPLCDKRFNLKQAKVWMPPLTIPLTQIATRLLSG